MKVIAYTVMTLLTSLSALAASAPPQEKIANSLLKVTLYLPNAANGFYRGTRFDWGGVVGDLEYQGHSYYGDWFTQTDPKVSDFVYQGSEIVAGPCSAITGPVEEFGVLGYEEAKAGGTFLKIGVGLLRKPDEAPYTPYRLYEIVDGGKWSVKKSKDAVEFIQELHTASSVYGYVYHKKISLVTGKPEMVIEHNLRNTGTHALHTNVYDHNFLVLDKKPIDAGFTITFPFTISNGQPADKEFAEFRKNQIVFLKTLAGQEGVSTPIEGFSNSRDDYKIRIENANIHAGMTITGDQPLAKIGLWTIRSVLAVEPFVDLSVEPGTETTWKYNYEYYTLPLVQSDVQR
jgi:hypothetical protein